MGRRQIKTCEPGDRPGSKGTGDAAGGRIGIEQHNCSTPALLPAALPEFNLPTGTLGNFQEHFK
jgi:hypothetical protein